MAATNPDYEAFLAWELKARDAVEKRYPKLALVKEAQEEWVRKNRQRQYATALEALRDALRDAEDRDKEIHVVRKNRGRKGLAPLDAQRTRQRTLVAARKEWRRVRRNRPNFEAEQAEADADGGIIANQRALRYTTHLIDLAERKISQYYDDIDQCRTARESLGSTLSVSNAPEDSTSEESESDAADEGERESSDGGAAGRDADSDRGDNESGEEAHREDQHEVTDEEEQVRGEEGERSGGPSDEDPVHKGESEVGGDEADEAPDDQLETPKSPDSPSRRGKDPSVITVKDPRLAPKKPGVVGGPRIPRKRKTSDDEDPEKELPAKKRSPKRSKQSRSKSAEARASESRRVGRPSSEKHNPSEPLSDESSEGDEKRLSSRELLAR